MTIGASRLAFLFVCISIFSHAPISARANVPVAYRLIAVRHGMPADILYAIALTESGKHIESLEHRRPWPWTLNIAGRGAYFPSRRTAWRALDAALATGETRIDIGLMQVNWGFHRQQLEDPWLALDPQHNLSVAAEILTRCYAERRDWWAAVGCYHAPNAPERARRYTERVIDAWRRVADDE